MSDARTFRPSDEFRARLEAEILRRHREPAAEAHRSIKRGTRLRSAVIASIALILGATAGFASAQIGRNAQRDSLLAAARADAEVADAQRDLARAEIREVERKLQLGLVGWDTSYQANVVLADAERRSNRLALDIEEIAATGASPRDELNAPVVAGRDFVKLRIEADLAAAQARLRSADAAQRMAEARMQAGLAPNASGTAVPDVATVRAEMAILAEKLALRAEFLKNGTSIEELTRRLHLARLKQEANVLQQQLATAKDRLARVERQHALGVAGEIELLRAKLEVRETELGIQKMQEQLDSRH